MLDFISMQTIVDRLNATRVKLTIEGSLSELDLAKREAVTRLGANLKIAGFRPGKAPQQMMEKSLDSNSLSQETLEIAVNNLYVEALMRERLRPVKTPQISVKSFVPYTQLSFDAEVEVIGEVKLGKYKGLNIKKDNVAVSIKEINAVLGRMQNQLASIKEVSRAAKKGDELIIDFTGTDAKTKEPVAGAESKDYHLVLGSNVFIPGFENNLIGTKKNDTRDFDLVFPEDYSASFLRKKKVHFKVIVKQVSDRKLPPLDDSLARLIGPFDNLELLKDNIKQELTTSKENDVKLRQQNAIVQSLVKASKVDIPESLLDEETARMERDQRQNAAYRGQTWSEYLQSQGINEEDFAISVKQQAAERIKTGLVLGAVASGENISITKDELQSKLEELKQQYASDQSMQAELNKEDNQQDIQNRLLVDKTVDKLVDLNS